MREITLKELDEIRKTGYRPGVVMCLINNMRLFLGFRRDYGLWVIPQGGINNTELLQDAIERETIEELGSETYAKYSGSFIYVGEGDIKFSPKSKGIRELKLDDGTKVSMIGKKYFFFGINVSDEKIVLADTEFDDYSWVNYAQGKFLLGKSYQIQKRELTLNALEQLKKSKLIN